MARADSWWDEITEDFNQVFASGTDTLDARGERALSVTLPPTPKGRPARVTLEVGVTDVNRQAVGATRTTLVHPAEFYVATKPLGASYFWQAGTPQSIGVVAVRPDGQKVPGVRVQGTIVRREWHRVRRERSGLSEVVGEWVSDTVARCTVTTAASAVPCAFTPNCRWHLRHHVHGGGSQRPRGDDELPALGVGERLGAVERRVAVQDGRDSRSNAVCGRRHGHGAVRLAVHERGGVDHRRARRGDRAAAPPSHVGLDDAQVPDHGSVRT